MPWLRAPLACVAGPDTTAGGDLLIGHHAFDLALRFTRCRLGQTNLAGVFLRLGAIFGGFALACFFSEPGVLGGLLAAPGFISLLGIAHRQLGVGLCPGLGFILCRGWRIAGGRSRRLAASTGRVTLTIAMRAYGLMQVQATA